jgi:hypothetical protein
VTCGSGMKQSRKGWRDWPGRPGLIDWYYCVCNLVTCKGWHGTGIYLCSMIVLVKCQHFSVLCTYLFWFYSTIPYLSVY